MIFKNKSLFFIGDSITANGGYIRHLRNYFKDTEHKIFFHNKGIPGGTTELIFSALEEELSGFTPDYAVISFGANDVGYWEYEESNLGSKELLKSRKERLEKYKDNLLHLVRALKKRGIQPILCSPFCVNPNLNDFYRAPILKVGEDEPSYNYALVNKRSFEQINYSLSDMGEAVLDIANKENVEFWDLFSYTFIFADDNCFNIDGIHYSESGNILIASSFISHLTDNEFTQYYFNYRFNGNDYLDYYDIDVDDPIWDMEIDERSYYFVKYNIMRSYYQGLSDEELYKKVKLWIKENGNIYGLTKRREEGFFRFVINHAEKQRELIEAIRT